MRLFFYSLILPIIFFACTSKDTSDAEQNDVVVTEDTSSVELAESKEGAFPLHNSMVEGFLMEYGQENPETSAIIKTNFGNIEVKLFTETPLHRANFVMMAKENYFNKTQFYRVIKDFMIQGGNSDDERVGEKRTRIGKFTLPPEISPQYIHQRGALCMARVYEDNPDKRSNPYEFYIIQGKKHTDEELMMIEMGYGISIPDKDKAIYKSKGGAPHLDNLMTVFGEVTKGMDVVDKIANSETDGSDWPKEVVIIESIELAGS